MGRSKRHARVLVFTVTHKEAPLAESVFGNPDPLVEVDRLGMLTPSRYANDDHLPFVLVKMTDRANLWATGEVRHWVGEVRPSVVLLVGTAGGVCRPINRKRTEWEGPNRGDVLASQYVHYGSYMKVSPGGNLQRHYRLEQPAESLIRHVEHLANSSRTDVWQQWLGNQWSGTSRLPKARGVEILCGDQIQDNPRDAMQQHLMKAFDRVEAVEMESAGVAAALHNLREIPTYAPSFVTVRGVSDLIWARDQGGPLTRGDLNRAEVFDRKREKALGPIGESGGNKTKERDDWSPRAAESASAFAYALLRRIVWEEVGELSSHPAIPRFDLGAVGGGV